MKTVDEIIYDASNSIPINEEYELLDIHLYLVLKVMYLQYSENYLSKNQGLILKQKVINQYVKESKIYNFQRDLYRIHINSIKKTERLRIELRKAIKESTMEKAFDIAIKLIELYSCEFKLWRKHGE